jgi:hypothetical protein
VKRTARLLAALAAVVALALVASACDSSPYAANVNSRTIRQTSLNAELRALASAPAYVTAVDQAAAQQGNSTTVVGSAPGTYNTTWVTGVLENMVVASALHQHLVATNNLPGPDMLAAARSVDAARYGVIWYQFPASLRDTQTQRDAEHAMVETTSVDATTLARTYQANQKYFFTQVCTHQIAITATNPDGSVNYPDSLAQATDAVGRINTGIGGAGGAVVCYTQPQLETQPVSFITTVMGLAPGRAAAPIKTSFGYQVIAVDSRNLLGLTPAVQRALSVALSAGQVTDTPLIRLLTAAHVSINPQYGLWSPKTVGISPPAVPTAG